jgi:hypothetical protein
MVVWVLRGLYYCILLNVIMMNFCMSITRALLLYEYYDGSIVVLYWILTIMNGWMKNMKGLLLCYIES